MTVLGKLVLQTQKRLANGGIDDARLEAELMWMSALGLDRTHLLAELSTYPERMAIKSAEELVVRRLKREPAAYLTNHKEFFGLGFHVESGVLIPRPETETVVEMALQFLAERSNKSSQAVVADIGTGSGAIAISLAIYHGGVRVDATDISEQALAIAALNVNRHQVGDHIKLLQGDLLSPLTRAVDLVVANLPYVMTSEIPKLEPEIRIFEPLEALDGGADGLNLITRFLMDVGFHLKDQGGIIIELDPRQVTQVLDLASVTFPRALMKIGTDLTGRPRVLSILP